MNSTDNTKRNKYFNVKIDKLKNYIHVAKNQQNFN